jgi:23S rRNA pseudouridine1911/1915/1917 synthase
VDPETPAEGVVEALEVPALLDGVRIDRALSMLIEVPRAAAASMVADGQVRVGGRVERTRSRPVRKGEVLHVSGGAGPPPLEPDAGVPFDVAYEDEDLLVVDKPAGVVVHPGAGRPRGTLVNGLVARYPDVARLAVDRVCPPTRPGIVHRLDRETSGLLAVARSARAYESLVAQLSARTVERRYLGLVAGIVPDDRGLVDAPIGRSDRQPTRMAVSAAGRDARTAYEVLERFGTDGGASLLSLELETGRTHQIRVHLAAIGHPVAGDRRYGKGLAVQVASLPAGRIFLHAETLGVTHPADGRRLRWTSPLPGDLRAALDALRPPGVRR